MPMWCNKKYKFIVQKNEDHRIYVDDREIFPLMCNALAIWVGSQEASVPILGAYD